MHMGRSPLYQISDLQILSPSLGCLFILSRVFSIECKFLNLMKSSAISFSFMGFGVMSKSRCQTQGLWIFSDVTFYKFSLVLCLLFRSMRDPF